MTWANQPATAGAAVAMPSFDGPLEWNVTGQVLDMYTAANNGFLIRDARGGRDRRRADAERPAQAQRLPAGARNRLRRLDARDRSCSAPASPTVEPDATFTFSSDRADAAFECALDGARVRRLHVAALRERAGGRRPSVDVRAKRPVRAVDPTPATHAWTIAIPPETTLPVPTSPSASADASLTFSADDPDATFECSLDGGLGGLRVAGRARGARRRLARAPRPRHRRARERRVDPGDSRLDGRGAVRRRRSTPGRRR